jgi:hypothetical protein
MKAKHFLLPLAIATTAGLTFYASHHRAGPADIYPPAWATGEINRDIQSPEHIATTICNSHWSTNSERAPTSYTTKLKNQQLADEGYPSSDASIVAERDKFFEEDHLISLELGGSPTSTRNLWPQPYQASIRDGGAKSKDIVETFLRGRVCSGEITLQEAQSEIVNDWYAVFLQIKKQPTFGSVAPSETDDEYKLTN